MKLKRFLNASMILAFLAMSQTALAQAFTVQGRVVDESGEPMIGVAVTNKDGNTLGVTDADGRYSIELNSPTKLKFTFVGSETITIDAKKATQKDIVMRQTATALDDVVVVGYGTQKKINLTGAVQSINSKDILRANVSNGSSALQGIVPGLTAVQNSGQPGNDQASLKLRGLGSLNSSTSPLILIDGVEGDFNRIDLNSIETISVLKDAASASIYGSRASNGVILITTKRGYEGKPTVTFNGYVGMNTPTTLPEPATAIEYMQAVDVARQNALQQPLYTNVIDIYKNGGVDQINYYDTDWRNEVIKSSALVQNYSVGVSGGSEFIKVFASAGYYSQDGLIDNNKFSRTSLRLNSDMKINKWVKLGIDASVRQANATSPVMDSPANIIGKALTMTPIMSGINADGTYGYGINGTNPIAMVRTGCTSNSTAPEYIIKTSLTITPLKGLSIYGAYTWKRNDGETNAFVKPYDTYENGAFKGSFPTTGSSMSDQRTKQVRKQYDLIGTYENTFGKNYLKVLMGFQSEELNYTYLVAGRKNYYYDGYQDLNNGDAATMTNSSARHAWAMLSYLFRVNYSFDDRYLFEVNGRYDGTSRFIGNNRWGFFPSVSAGWRISQEPFWESAKNVMDNFKLRASYGLLGNQAISSYYPYSASIGSATGYGYWFDKEFSPGVAQTQLANPDITWEKSHQFDIGVDYAFLKNRLSGSFDYYVRNIDEMLQQFPVPLFVGMTSPWENAGSMRNNGWEFSIAWQDRIGNVDYYIKGNISDVKNKVINLYGKEYKSGTTLTTEGKPYGSWYGYVADGYFSSREEIDASPVYGGNKANVAPGDIKYKDISGPDGVPDGKIDSHDRTIIGPTLNRQLQNY